ncbi:hypothetical protein [Sphingobium phenoxybenzoativorans]|uniref:hypothetical protein n=1 Tax=Sphingobium phenoxybenzoativorans TaxID=1592790 RepID=UPI0008728493|nr:hypothetical protein [Sphingobium phenoxybenzoativorans]
MMSLSGVIPWLYMAAFIIIGWRLYVIRWHGGLKIVSGVAMVLAPPLLLVLPALRNPAGNFADLLMATGIGMLVMGALCLLGGAVAAHLRNRSRRA